jgi:outer membrane protein assembly factor BamB
VPEGTNGWRQYQADYSKSGYVATAVSDDLAERWRADVDGMGLCTVADGTVYATTGGDRSGLVAVDAADGSVEWRFETSSDSISAPAIVDGTVYFGTGTTLGTDGAVHALDADDGAQVWRTEAQRFAFSPVVAAGLVFVGTGEGKRVVALEASSGESVWSYEADGVTYGVGLANETLFFGSGGKDGSVYAVDATDGTERWQAGIDDITYMPTLVDDLVCYCTVYAEELVALDVDWGRNAGGTGWVGVPGTRRPRTGRASITRTTAGCRRYNRTAPNAGGRRLTGDWRRLR